MDKKIQLLILIHLFRGRNTCFDKIIEKEIIGNPIGNTLPKGKTFPSPFFFCSVGSYRGRDLWPFLFEKSLQVIQNLGLPLVLCSPQLTTQIYLFDLDLGKGDRYEKCLIFLCGDCWFWVVFWLITRLKKPPVLIQSLFTGVIYLIHPSNLKIPDAKHS